jgi:hypothetical protein
LAETAAAVDGFESLNAISRLTTSCQEIVFFWIGKLFQYLLDIRRLKHLHDFYLYLLGVSDAEFGRNRRRGRWI